MNLSELTGQLVNVLRGGDPWVQVNASVDAVTPPMLLVLWSETYLEPVTFCTAWARPAITCVAGRVDAPAGKETLDALVLFTLARIARVYEWERVTAPERMNMAGVDYLIQRVILRVPVTLPLEARWPRANPLAA